MPEYEFSVYRIFPYKDVIVDSVLIEGKCGSEKTYTLSYFTQWNLSTQNSSKIWIRCNKDKWFE